VSLYAGGAGTRRSRTVNVLPLPGPSLVLHTKDRAVALAVDGYENRTASDKTPSHYEEDHFISLELGGNPRDPKSLWPEMWGTPGTPLTSRGPKAKDAVENELHKEVGELIGGPT